MTVHFIGAGPGAADLLTLRAVRLLASSPVCVYAGTYLDEAVLAHCPPGATLIDSQHLDLDTITRHLVAAHAAGQDVDANGNGVVREERLYQLIRQPGAIRERQFTIEFLDPGVEAFAFTFG